MNQTMNATTVLIKWNMEQYILSTLVVTVFAFFKEI